MYCWRNFHGEEVERDFARLRKAGFDTVRIFLLWEDFQPAPERVSKQALARLVRVADAAADNGLSLLPTLFTGHMSGANWIPGWALDVGGSSRRFPVVSGRKVVNAGLANWYTNEAIIRAQARLACEIAAVLGNHAALWAWDLGNENSNCVTPPSREAGLGWLERMTREIRSVDPSHPITLGLHMEDLEEDRRLGPKEAACVCDFLCMHGYPMYAEWADSPIDELILPFLGLITRWLGGRDVLFGEFGAPSVSRRHSKAGAAARSSRVPLLDEEVAARFTRRALDALHRFGFLGAMVWCYADYSEALGKVPPFDVAPHERYFGLWRADGSPKPALAGVRQLARARKREASNDFSWIDISGDAFYVNPKDSLRRLYRKFRGRYAGEKIAHGQEEIVSRRRMP